MSVSNRNSFASLIRGKQKIAAVVAHTHWDRAWYHPFELFRLSLCRVFSRVLDLLEEGKGYEHFTFDGQTVVAEDFLELYPEQRDRVAKLVRQGRLTLGPFYVLPDQFLITGESHVRNGLIGQQIAESFGRSSRQGYVADPFGLISQCPQIFAELGIESILFSRGVSKQQIEEAGPTFWWAGPDGQSRIYGLLQVEGYSNLVNWGVPLKSFPHGDPDTSDIDLAASEKRFAEVLAQYAKMRCGSRVLFFGSGNDHHPPQHQLPTMIAHNARHFPDVAFVQVDTDGLVDLMKQEKPRLRTLQGELHAEGAWTTLNGTLESRPYLKQQFDACAAMLEKHAEPLAAVVGRLALAGRVLREEHHRGFAFNVGNDKALGDDYPAEAIRYAWKTLLRCAPHDDICGCSIDPTHEDAENRTKRSLEISSLIAGDSLLRLAANARPPEGKYVAQITVFNPIHARQAVIQRHMTVPGNGTQWRLVDEQGQEIPATIRFRDLNKPYRRWNSLDFETLPHRTMFVTVVFEAHLPAVGYRTFYLENWDGRRRRKGADVRREGPTYLPVSMLPPKYSKWGAQTSLRTDAVGSMENDFVRVTLHPDGTFDLTDKRNNASYTKQHQLQDQGDAGDLYVSRLLDDQIVKARQNSGRIRLVEQTPLRITYEVQLALPAVSFDLNAERSARSRPYGPLQIAFRFTLLAASPVLHISARWTNRHREHRLTVQFPTMFKTAATQAGSTWDVVDHTAPFIQASCREFVTAASAGKRVTILSRSMHSYDAHLDGGRLVLSKTLLKANGFVNKGLIPHWPAPEGNCPREIVQEYAFVPGQESDPPEMLARLANEFVHPPLVEHSLWNTHWRGQADLPATASFIEFPPQFELAALKRCEDRNSLIVRLINWSDRPAAGELVLSPLLNAKSAWLTNLREQRAARVTIKDHRLPIKARPRQILTLEMQ